MVQWMDSQGGLKCQYGDAPLLRINGGPALASPSPKKGGGLAEKVGVLPSSLYIPCIPGEKQGGVWWFSGWIPMGGLKRIGPGLRRKGVRVCGGWGACAPLPPPPPPYLTQLYSVKNTTWLILPVVYAFPKD